MCLFKTHRLPKISRKPIQCYKIFNVCCGILNTPHLCVPCQIGDTIEARDCWIKGIFNEELTSEVVHAICEKHRAVFRKDLGQCICLCEIPPFTPYWYGTYDEIAASKIKIIKRL